MDIMRKNAGFMWKIQQLKLKTSSMFRMLTKKKKTEHFSLTQNFSTYRINLISAGQLWYVWSFSDILLTGISSFHTVTLPKNGHKNVPRLVTRHY